MRSLRVFIPPTEPAVTLAEAKLHLRVDGTDEDTYITALVSAATSYIESTFGLAIMRQTIVETFDDWECVGCEQQGLYLDRSGPDGVESISEISVRSQASIPAPDPVVLDADDYQTDLVSRPARIAAPAMGILPVVFPGVIGAITVTYHAGETDAADVPEEIKVAIKMLVADLYENRSDEITGTIVSKISNGLSMLLASWKLRSRS